MSSPHLFRCRSLFLSAFLPPSSLSRFSSLFDPVLLLNLLLSVYPSVCPSSSFSSFSSSVPPDVDESDLFHIRRNRTTKKAKKLRKYLKSRLVAEGLWEPDGELLFPLLSYLFFSLCSFFSVISSIVCRLSSVFYLSWFVSLLHSEFLVARKEEMVRFSIPPTIIFVNSTESALRTIKFLNDNCEFAQLLSFLSFLPLCLPFFTLSLLFLRSSCFLF